MRKKSKKKAALSKATPPAAREIVMVVRAPNSGLTLEQWDKYLAKFGLTLEWSFTADAWARKERLWQEASSKEKEP